MKIFYARARPMKIFYARALFGAMRLPLSYVVIAESSEQAREVIAPAVPRGDPEPVGQLLEGVDSTPRVLR